MADDDLEAGAENVSLDDDGQSGENAATSEGRMSASILVAMPIVMGSKIFSMFSWGIKPSLNRTFLIQTFASL